MPVLRWTDAIDRSKLQHHCINSSISLTPPFFHRLQLSPLCRYHHSSQLVMPSVTQGHKLTPRKVEWTYIETNFTILPQLSTRSRDIWDIKSLESRHHIWVKNAYKVSIRICRLHVSDITQPIHTLVVYNYDPLTQLIDIMTDGILRMREWCRAKIILGEGLTLLQNVRGSQLIFTLALTFFCLYCSLALTSSLDGFDIHMILKFCRCNIVSETVLEILPNMEICIWQCTIFSSNSTSISL